ncbi:hypothetical protein TPE_0804 [Treponema pedis str. T A4]|uniref:Uncharacterized protein n=1 Tax=Treponema pedis str. T A4 TaxID=1291379 RepID=S5ZT53_9SPIR|nr:hypothetical protein TPE_0804 [Treponema pedis str. T A4]
MKRILQTITEINSPDCKNIINFIFFQDLVFDFIVNINFIL